MQPPITFGGGGTEIPESFDNGKNNRVGHLSGVAAGSPRSL